MSTTVSPTPYLAFMNPNNSGAPASGFKLFTYIAGTSTKQNTWTDSTQAVLNSNPIILDSNGAAFVWLDPTLIYKYVLTSPTDTDPPTSPLRSVDNLESAVTNRILPNLIPAANPQTTAEINAGVTPLNFSFAPGNVLRYGTNTIQGTTDMSAAIQAALRQAAQGGAAAYLPEGIYFVALQLTIGSNVRFYGDGAQSQINFGATSNADNFLGLNISNSTIQDIQFNNTVNVVAGNPPTAYPGTVALRGTTDCTVERCQFTGGYFSGVTIAASATLNSSSNRVVGNYFYGATNTTQDSDDIRIDCTAGFGASYNIIDSNQCFGAGNWHGIAVQASTNPNTLMTKNIVCNNKVGAHTAYGILLYTHTAGDTYNQVIGNYVENIQGTSLTGQTGTGIYVASQTAVMVSNNTVVNCCVVSSSQFNQGGITILSGFTGSPNVITGNAVYDMAQANVNAIVIGGINIISTPPGSVVTGNLVSQQVAGGGTSYVGIYVQGGNGGVTVTGNTVNIVNTIAGTRGIYAFANGANITNLTVNGNTVLGCTSRGITLEQTGGFTTSNFSITGNTVTGGSAASVPLYITNSSNGSITGNTASATTVVALNVSAVTGTRYTGNFLQSTGTNAITTNGACTGSLLDYSNNLSGNVNNAGTGFIVETLGTAQPGAGTFAVGDTIRNSAPAGAGVYMWICTTAGTPGTFKTISNS